MDFRTSPAGRRYLARFAPAMAAYVAAILGVAAWFRHAPPTGALAFGAAVLPAAPILAIIWAMGRYLVEETDEYLRARLVEAMLWAVGATLAITTVWGFLQSFGLTAAPPLYLVFVLFCAALGLAQCVLKLREARS